MRRLRYNKWAILSAVMACAVWLTGCSTAGSAVSELGLAGVGGVAGYQLSDQKIGGAVAGAAVGYAASKIAQSHAQQAQAEAEKRGYDRALNQAVKQQYWVIQNQQRSREALPESEARLVPVVIPETKINGVVQIAHVEYLRLQP